MSQTIACAFKEWVFRKTNRRQIRVVESILSWTSLCSYLAERYTCLLVKKSSLWAAHKWLFHSLHIKDVFCGINFCDVGILWEKKDTIYMRIIYMSFLSKNLLCQNVYTISSFMWSNELFSILKWRLYLCCIFLFSFLTYEVRYSKNIKFCRRNAESIFAIGFQTIFCGTYFCDWLIQNCILRIKFLRFQVKITKISSAIIYSAKIHNHKNFGP